MATNQLKVNRMALNKSSIVEFSIQPPPKLPADVIERFPSMKAYEDAWARWAANTQNLIQGLLTLRVEGS